MLTRGEKYQLLAEKVAYSLAKQYGLKDSDFSIRLWPTNRFEASIKSDDSRGLIRVIIGHVVNPNDSNVIALLHRVLKNVSAIKHGKPGKAIDLYIGLQGRKEEVEREYAEFRSIPSVLKDSECEVTTVIRVTVKHKESGLSMTRDAQFGKVTETITKCRVELSEVVQAVKDNLEKQRLANESNNASSALAVHQDASSLVRE